MLWRRFYFSIRSRPRWAGGRLRSGQAILQLGNQEPFNSSGGRSGEMQISRLIGWERACFAGIGPLDEGT